MENTNHHIEPNEDLLIRYFANELTVQEQEKLLHLVKTDKSIATKFRNYALIKDNVDYRKTVDYKPAYQDFLKRATKKQKTKKTKTLYSIISIAALFLIVFSINILWNSNPKSIMVATLDLKKEIILPDNSHIILNKFSEISYMENFAENRSITLKKGDAYFEVEKDSIHPFVVKINDARISVLGTGFGIKLDSVNNTVTVAVTHGKVKVQCSDSDKGKSLIKNQTSYYTVGTSSFSEPVIMDQNELSWKNNELVFKSTAMVDVVKAINNHFGTDYELENGSMDSCRLNAVYPNPELQNIIQMLKIAFDIDIKIENNKQIIKGPGC